jgi:putative flavoprotein involved in K+ transport
MIHTTAVVVGAGHAGLAMSRRLTERSIDHVVLERGEVANSWRTQRWPSLRLLTPNWQTRLPGHPYTGDDPDGFMPVADVVATLTRYARLVGAPVRTATTVHTLRAVPHGFQIRAGDDLLCARAVILATGACTRPAIPGVAAAVPPSITTLTPLAYRDPGQLPDGGVLIVGASATGILTVPATSATTAAWSPAPRDSTSSACRCSAPAPPPTSTAQPPTPRP